MLAGAGAPTSLTGVGPAAPTGVPAAPAGPAYLMTVASMPRLARSLLIRVASSTLS